MKLVRLVFISGILLFLIACGKHEYRLTVVNSKSFAEKQITPEATLAGKYSNDSILPIQETNLLSSKLNELIAKSELLKESETDSSWILLLKNWEEVKIDKIISSVDTSAISQSVLRKWAELNSILLRFSGEVRFGDELEKLVYKHRVLTESMLKSVIYTHVYDQIFINLIGSSSLTHYHTTGGTIKLIQQTDFPASNEIILTCEASDVRYLDVFIRIPGWAINPTVTHGRVKYVARPGEYCQISRKWKDGDEFNIRLKNQAFK